MPRPHPILGVEACAKWLKEHPTRWDPIFLICNAKGFMWLHGSGRGLVSLLALKHVDSGEIHMIQNEALAEDDCQRLFVNKKQP